MAFTIPDTAAAWNAIQARMQTGDVSILVAGLNAEGVASGCAVSPQGSPNMTVAVASGSVRIGGATVAVTSGNVTITSNSSGNPRLDLICVNSSGTKSAQAGTAAAVPKYPSIPASSVVLAAVLVPTGASSITANNITDKRVQVETMLAVGTTAGTVAAGDDSRFTQSADNPQTASYVLVLSDAGKTVRMSVASGNTLTVPPNASVAFPTGTIVAWEQYGAGTTTLTPGSGVTIRSRGGILTSAGQYASGSLRKIDTNEWMAAGDLA